jgi:cytochrome c oxidase subunit II
MSGVLVAGLVIAFLVAALLIAIAAGFNPGTALSRVVESFFPPAAVTAQGQSIRDLYTIVFVIAAIIFFVVEALIIWTVIRYKRKPGDDTLPPQTHGNMLAEALWTIIPTIIVAFLFVISWQTLNSVEATSAQPDVKIRAYGAQFQWQFDYYDENDEIVFTQLLPIGADGGMAVPVGQNIRLLLESPDVIHSFYVPQFLFKRDVNPGRPQEFEFRVNEADAGQTFRGQCAELCGAGHRLMLFDVHALPAAEFDTWLADRIAGAPPPAPSGEPGGSGEPPQSPAPGQSGEPAGSPPPAGEAPTVEIAAFNIAFDKNELSVPADTPFRIEFDNQEAAPHNVAIHEGSPTGPNVFQGEIITGPRQITYEVPALAAGSYGFICTVHPSMTGTLTAE